MHHSLWVVKFLLDISLHTITTHMVFLLLFCEWSVGISECFWTQCTHLSLCVHISDMIEKSTLLFEFFPTLNKLMFSWLLMNFSLGSCLLKLLLSFLLIRLYLRPYTQALAAKKTYSGPVHSRDNAKLLSSIVSCFLLHLISKLEPGTSWNQTTGSFIFAKVWEENLGVDFQLDCNPIEATFKR